MMCLWKLDTYFKRKYLLWNIFSLDIFIQINHSKDANLADSR